MYSKAGRGLTRYQDRGGRSFPYQLRQLKWYREFSVSVRLQGDTGTLFS